MQPDFNTAYNTLYKGWDRASAQADYNAGGWRNKAGAEQFQSTPSYSGAASNVSPSTSNVLQSAEAIRQYNVSANQPAIASYEASKQPLQDRYKSLLDEMKATKTQDVNRQTISTNAELARRGVTGGLGEQTMQQAISPLNQIYTSKIGQVGAAESADIADINKAIALLQSGNPEASISTAQNLSALEEQQRQQAIENAQNQLEYQQVTLPYSQAQIANIQSEIANRGNTNTGNYNQYYDTKTGQISTNNNQSFNQQTESKPTYKLGMQSATSKGGQWFWDYSSNDWIPIQ